MRVSAARRILLGLLFAAAVPPAAAQPPDLLRDAERLLASGQLDEAERRAAEATERNPASVIAWNVLARARYARKDWRHAVDAFERAIALAPGEAKLHASAGLCRFELHDYAAAAASLRRASELDRSYARPHVALGRIAEETGDFPAAERHLREAVRLDPRDPTARYFLALHLFRTRRLDDAIQEFGSCLREAPDLPGAHLNLSHALRRSGRMAEADAHLSRFRALSEASARNEQRRRQLTRLLNAARLDMDEGRLDSALALLVKARTAAPDEAVVHALLAQVHRMRGDEKEYREAQAAFQRLARGAR